MRAPRKADRAFSRRLVNSVVHELAFIAAYCGGPVDSLIRWAVDVGLTIPSLVILVVPAVSTGGGVTVHRMALAVARTAWLWPTRTIRSQFYLSRRELT